MMTKLETKNLLRNHTCDSCKWLNINEHVNKDFKIYLNLNEYCTRKVTRNKKIPIPDSRTCEFWQDPNDKYLKFSLSNKEEVKDFFTNGKVFDFDHSRSIEGIELYYAPTKEKIWEQKFDDGPYEFPDSGGSLTMDMSKTTSDIAKKMIMGL